MNPHISLKIDFTNETQTINLDIFIFQNLTEDDPLNTILSDMGSPKSQLPYHEDISITLTLKSRWEQVPGKCTVQSRVILKTFSRLLYELLIAFGTTNFIWNC